MAAKTISWASAQSRTAMARTLKLVVGVIGGIALLGIAHEMTVPPKLHTVLVLKSAITPGQPISAADFTTMKTLNAWPGALTTVPTGMVAKTALPAGTPLLDSVLTPTWAFNGLKPGEALWTVAVTPATSGLVQPGDRVQVWSAPTSGGSSSSALLAPTLWATGVRVVGIYSSGGTPVTTTGSTSNGAIGLVTLAVPDRDLSVLLSLANPILIQDPYQTHFALTVNLPNPSSASSAKNHSTKPATTTATPTTPK